VERTPPGRELTMDEYRAIMTEIHERHRFGRSLEKGSHHIKYVRPHIDTRDWKIFRIAFATFSTEETIFDFRDSTDPMNDRIMAWLNGTAAPELA
jgi:hypothetical protein